MTLTLTDLYHHSIDVILRNQASSGAYLACPSFESYVYSWLRDGSFIAHAMDCSGQHESAARFFRWVNTTILKHASKITAIERGIAQGLMPGKIDFLHTRYTVDGEEVTADSTWGNFQPDGYGSWLWALEAHIRVTADFALLNEVWGSVLLTVRYLVAIWRLPTYDCWEEHLEYVHPYTLGAIYAGLQAARRLAMQANMQDPLDVAARTAEDIHVYLLEAGVRSGHLIKSINPQTESNSARDETADGVDASLMALSIPFQVFAPQDPIFQATLDLIERELRYPGGGVYRYWGDTYYGGGEWLLLAGFLGWQVACAGDESKARSLLEWIAEQADDEGNLPEQVSDHVQAPKYLPYWRSRWGQVASPLLWSHAMYLILYQAVFQG